MRLFGMSVWLELVLVCGLLGSQSAAPLRFEVATIKPARGCDGWKLQSTPDGYTGRCVSLRQIVQEAYALYEDGQVLGGPAWMDHALFDVEAKFDGSMLPDLQALTFVQRRTMLQPLLAERFGLRAHRETREKTIYTLVAASNGVRLRKSDGNGICHVLMSAKGHLKLQECSVADLAFNLHFDVGRTINDRSGLGGRYDMELHWSPEDVGGAEAVWPSLFTAVKEQLGLTLEPGKAPVEVLVVESATLPEGN